jgi:hypothetical protein
VAKPIVFGTYQFRTKKSATEEARRRISQYEAGDRLNIEDEDFFASLFTLHSEYPEKRGAGVDHIKVERDFHSNLCLYIHRIDGSTIDCSWVHCIQPASQKTITSMAFRRAVKDTVMAFKEEQLKIVKECPELKTPLTYDNSHVSYSSPSFEALLEDFLHLQKICIEDVGLNNPKPQDQDQRGIVSDAELTTRWCDFHQENANLRLLSQEANLRRLKS